MKRFTLAILSIFLSLCACTKAEEESVNSQMDGKGFKISLNGWNGDGYSSFSDGDEVGIYVVDYDGETSSDLANSGNRADNVKYTFTDSKWTADKDVYFKDSKTNVDIYGYSPYAFPDSVRKWEVEIAKDQSEATAYSDADFLWGKATNVSPTSDKINIAFSHRMANLHISLEEGTGFSEGEWASTQISAVLKNFVHTSQIDLATGSVVPVGEATTAGLVPYKNGDEFWVIVPPQVLASGKNFLSVSVGGFPCNFGKSEDLDLEQGRQYNFTFTVNKTSQNGVYEMVLSGESITDWELSSSNYDFTPKTYLVVNVENAGELSASIKGKGWDATQIRNLKINGKLDATDFWYMRDSMKTLQCLNLKEVKIEEYTTVPWQGPEDEIPYQAFCDRSEKNPNLVRIIFPDNLKGIGKYAFMYTGLTGSLAIPEGVSHIDDSAFWECTSLTGELRLPSTIKKLGDCAFYKCAFTTELLLPEGIEEIGKRCFSYCNFSGKLNLPESLSEIAEGAFEECDFTGDLNVPDNISKIHSYAFCGCKFDGVLTLPDDLLTIETYAFSSCKFRGSLKLPSSLTRVDSYAFWSCKNLSGTLVLPNGLLSIGEGAFMLCSGLSGSLEFPQSMLSVGEKAFYGCSSMEKLVFGKNLETIQTNAFNGCSGVNGIICLNEQVPYLGTGAFDGVPKANFAVEVPESSLVSYKTDAGWGEFKRITAHHELYLNMSGTAAIGTAVTRSATLYAEGYWELKSKPDWVSVSPGSGNGKAEISIEFSALESGFRKDSLVFSLKDKDYSTSFDLAQYSYDYGEDEILTLQSASVGDGVNIMIVGDGFDAAEVADGTYLAAMNEAIGYFFDIEPFKSYKDYFNVYTGIAVSPESGIGTVDNLRYNRFGTSFEGGVGLRGINGESDYDNLFKYARKADKITLDNKWATLIIVVANTSDYGGKAYMNSDGSAIAYCPMTKDSYPYDFRGIVQHEAGGHGFGHLADEYIYYNAFIEAADAEAIKSGKSHGWYRNLSLSGKSDEVPWSHLLSNDTYKQTVDIYEGGFGYSRGVYRSESNSCMNNNIPHFSTISRQAIVERIMEIAGEGFSFAQFMEKDAI